MTKFPELRLVEIDDISAIEAHARQLAQEDGSAPYYKAYAGLARQQHFIAEDQGTEKGFLSLALESNPLLPDSPISQSSAAGKTELTRLLIFGPWRRQGFAGRIFEHLSVRFGGLYSRVLASNQPAIACYLKYGWELNSLTLTKNEMLIDISLENGPEPPGDEVLELERKGWTRHYYTISLARDGYSPRD